MRIVAALLACCLPLLASAESMPPALEGLGLRAFPEASRDMAGWRKPDKVVVRSIFGDDAARKLREALPGIEIVSVSTVDEAVAAIAGAQVLIGYCEQAIFDAADKLHWVQVYFAGVENCVTTPAMKSGKLVLSNGQRLGSPTLADHAIALMMSLTRGLAGYHASQARGQWEPNWGARPRYAGCCHQKQPPGGTRLCLLCGPCRRGAQVGQRGRCRG